MDTLGGRFLGVQGAPRSEGHSLQEREWETFILQRASSTLYRRGSASLQLARSRVCKILSSSQGGFIRDRLGDVQQ